jgi:hypothetical protein
MVQAIINIDENANRVLNIIKAKFGLKDKSEAINMMAEQYNGQILEPELRPEYVKKALKVHNQSSIRIGTVENLRKRYEN